MDFWEAFLYSVTLSSKQVCWLINCQNQCRPFNVEIRLTQTLAYFYLGYPAASTTPAPAYLPTNASTGIFKLYRLTNAKK